MRTTSFYTLLLLFPYYYSSVTPSRELLIGESTFCGGHGDWVGVNLGGCICYNDEVRGHWKLATLSHTSAEAQKQLDGSYDYVDVVHSVEACLLCEDGWQGEDCRSPIYSPTVSPSGAPTLSP